MAGKYYQSDGSRGKPAEHYWQDAGFFLRVAAPTSVSGGETSVLRARVISTPSGNRGQYIYISSQKKVVIVFTGSIMGFPLGVGYTTPANLTLGDFSGVACDLRKHI
jgi:hypothetical protein